MDRTGTNPNDSSQNEDSNPNRSARRPRNGGDTLETKLAFTRFPSNRNHFAGDFWSAARSATALNVGLCPVRPADMLSAARGSADCEPAGAHRLQVYAPTSCNRDSGATLELLLLAISGVFGLSRFRSLRRSLADTSAPITMPNSKYTPKINF